MDCGMPGFPVHHQLLQVAQAPVHWVSDAIPTISSSVIPFLLLPSIFPSIRVLSNESVLHIRWPEYWSVSISPSNEYRRLISSGSVHVNHSVMSDSLQPHESQQSRPPCSSPTPRVHSDSRPSAISDTIQPFHPLSSPSPPAPNPSQHQSLFQ